MGSTVGLVLSISVLRGLQIMTADCAAAQPDAFNSEIAQIKGEPVIAVAASPEL
jgi:hypothetical protein